MNRFLSLVAAAAFSVSGGHAYAQSASVTAVALACVSSGPACTAAVQAAVAAAAAAVPAGATFNAGAFLAELTDVARANPELQGAMANAISTALDEPDVVASTTPAQRTAGRQVATSFQAGTGVPEQVVASFSSAG